MGTTDELNVVIMVVQLKSKRYTTASHMDIPSWAATESTQPITVGSGPDLSMILPNQLYLAMDCEESTGIAQVDTALFSTPSATGLMMRQGRIRCTGCLVAIYILLYSDFVIALITQW